MPPGVLWVSSRIADPTSPSTTLTPSKFCDWYENQHIHEVTSLPGVPCAARYEAITPQPDAEGWSAKAPWLTVYEMPDIDYRTTREFKGLDGQSWPGEELLQGVFGQARFDTRFYEQIGVFESSEAGRGPAKFLMSWAVAAVKGAEEMQKIKGFRRVRTFKVVNATTLDRFVRREEPVEEYVALIEFDGDQLPVEEVIEIMGHGAKGNEVGWYRLKRVYDEDTKAR